MRIAKYVISPNERKHYTIEYDDWLDNAETIDDVEFTIPENTTTPLVVDETDIDIAGTLVSYFVSGGVADENISVIVTITTSNGQIKEDEIVFSVRDT